MQTPILLSRWMKILHIANFGFNKQGAHFYCTDRKISAGLTENGHFVYDFSFRDMARMGTIFKTKKLGANWANKEILKIVKNLKPHLILVGHSDLLSVETLLYIRENYPQIKMAFWFVDWLCEPHKVNFVQSMATVVDAVFCTTGGELLQQFKYHHNKVAYIPNMVFGAVESLQQFNQTQYQHQLVFCGTVYKDPAREGFLHIIKQQLGDQLSCFGAFDQPTFYGQDYLDLLSKSRCGLNLSRRNDITLYSSDRIAQLTGNGLLTFSAEIPGFRQLYQDDEVVYFKDAHDLIEKYEYFSTHLGQAKQVAINGHKKSHTSFNSARVTKFMLELIFEQSLSEQYEWSHEVYA